MKKLLPLLIIFLASCGPSRYLECPKYVGIAIDTIPLVQPVSEYTLEEKPQPGDTTCEWMHISMRDMGFVLNRTALAVRRNGYCIAHLQADNKPFPEHWHVGWCQGKDELLNRMVTGRAK